MWNCIYTGDEKNTYGEDYSCLVISETFGELLIQLEH